jgi:F0F1-type ATP synthase epsilon subunit
MILDVEVLNPKEVIFEGKARSVMVPGEQGVFEILPFHKRILSRLVSGTVIIDQKTVSIQRGIVKADLNKVTIILEEG